MGANAKICAALGAALLAARAARAWHLQPWRRHPAVCRASCILTAAAPIVACSFQIRCRRCPILQRLSRDSTQIVLFCRSAEPTAHRLERRSASLARDVHQHHSACVAAASKQQIATVQVCQHGRGSAQEDCWGGSHRWQGHSPKVCSSQPSLQHGPASPLRKMRAGISVLRRSWHTSCRTRRLVQPTSQQWSSLSLHGDALLASSPWPLAALCSALFGSNLCTCLPHLCVDTLGAPRL